MFAYYFLCNIDVAFVSSVRHYWWSQWAECCSFEHISPHENIPLFSHSLVLLFLNIKCLLSFMAKLHDICLIPFKKIFICIILWCYIIVLYIQNLNRIHLIEMGFKCALDRAHYILKGFYQFSYHIYFFLKTLKYGQCSLWCGLILNFLSVWCLFFSDVSGKVPIYTHTHTGTV